MEPEPRGIDDIRELILGCDDIQYAFVNTPEWPVKGVWVRSLEGSERDEFEASCVVRKGKKVETSLKDFRAKLVCLSVCMGEGDPRPVFNAADITRLGRKSAKPIDRIFAKAKELSAMSDDDVEELVKN